MTNVVNDHCEKTYRWIIEGQEVMTWCRESRGHTGECPTPWHQDKNAARNQ